MVKNCKNCNWESGEMVCFQGHVRKAKYENLILDDYHPLENCHAWKKMKKKKYLCDGLSF